jgi:D-tyrosyl-tRNA(Tyr) deacylase
MPYNTIVIWLVLGFFTGKYHAMRIVVQRVRSASVTLTDNQSIASTIGPGLLALVGLHQDDTLQDLEYCCKKLLGCKLWENESGGQWRHSVKQKSYDCLCVSQFTLYGTLSKKHQPDYKLAMKAVQAEQLYQEFIDLLKRDYSSDKIHNGVFGAMMDVSLVNDGPVTIVIDSREADQSNGKTESPSEDDDCL